MGHSGREPPFFFLKPADAVLAVPKARPGRWPTRRLTANLHHEIELVVAIGRGGRNIAAADAPAHLGLRRRPGHDAPRSAERDEEAGPPLVHRQGLRTVGADRPDGAHRPHRRMSKGAITLHVNGELRQKGDLGT
jgi:fumarylpyruvate hydrolase